MNILKRDAKTIYYCNFDGTTQAVDSEGYETGESVTVYTVAEPVEAAVSEPTGRVVNEMFGNDLQYDKVAVLRNNEAQNISESTVFFVDKAPEYDENDAPIFDYIVRRVAKSHNFTAVALKRVDKT